MLTSNSTMSEPATTVETREVEEKKSQSSWTGGTFGIIVFLAGVALLLETFKLAFDQFSQSPETALRLSPDKPITQEAISLFAWLIFRVLLLLVMSIVGAIVANRGIKMYTDSRHR